MKPKAAVKMAVDIVLTGVLLFLMGYQFWGEAAHEWAGAGMFVLFILHHILNRGWHKTLFKGKYSPARIFQLIINLLLSLNMIGQMISGIVLSRHVFVFLPFSGGIAFARLQHMAAAYWGFVLMALHLGLHWNMFMGISGKALKLRQPSRVRSVLLPILGAGIAVYGLSVFIRRDLLTCMLVRTQFVFLDFGEFIPFFYLDYLAMMGTFIFAAHYVSRLLRKASGKKRPKKEGGYLK